MDEVNSTLGLAREHARSLKDSAPELIAQVGCGTRDACRAGCRGLVSLPCHAAHLLPCSSASSTPHCVHFSLFRFPPLRQLEEIQSRLFDVGAAVATPQPTSSGAKLQVSDC